MLTNNGPLRVVVLCSKRAPGLLHLLDTLSHGVVDVAGVVTSEPDLREADALLARGIPVATHDIHAFYAARRAALTRDWSTRAAYDRTLLDLIAGFEPDLVLLDGYLYLLTAAVLEAHRHRILNLHFSDLTLRGDDARPRYVGIRAVRDAIADGQQDTRATVHLVNSEPDGGPPLALSWRFPVSPLVERARAWQATDMVKAYAFAHQEWMLREAAGPMLCAALQLVASGRVSLDALGAKSPQTVRPWLVEESGRVTAPDRESLRGGLGVLARRDRLRRRCPAGWASGRGAAHAARSHEGGGR